MEDQALKLVRAFPAHEGEREALTASKWDELVKETNKAEVEAKTAADWARKKWAEFYRVRDIAIKAEVESKIADAVAKRAQAILEAERVRALESNDIK
jgi:hypothetical protein